MPFRPHGVQANGSAQMTTELPSLEAQLRTCLAAATGDATEVRLESRLEYGAINRTARLRQGEKRYFLKLNSAERLQMFEAEAEGLLELGAAASLRVPQPVCLGCHQRSAFLVLEYLDLVPDGDEAALGAGLAALHEHTAPQFGWQRDNTIGLTPQHNVQASDWAHFWREQRLAPQLRLATERGYGPALAEPGGRLLEGVAALLAGHRPAASLLHGDLWRGNAAYLPDGLPVVYDPAVYFGDGEADLAMCELFGGFGATFYSTYRWQHPLQPGHSTRRKLYQLYHMFNHLNLFGTAYLAQAQALTQELLSELQ